jgi:HSP20 family protein
MSNLARRDQRAYVFPDLMDKLDMPFWGWRQATGEGSSTRPHTPRAEDYVADGNYVIRMELPGIDPDKDVDITVDGDTLQIIAQRETEKKDGRRTEFRYGMFSRSIQLPHGVATKEIKASYDKGILAITVPLPNGKTIAAQKVPIQPAGL